MTPLDSKIFVDYQPNALKKLDSGILLLGEDSQDFLEVQATSVGLKCTEVKKGDTLLIRKEDLYQTEIGNELIFMTKEELVLTINGHPAGKRLYVQPETQKVTKTGIVINTENDLENKKAVVLSVGSKCEDVSVGDIVLLEKYSGIKIKDKLYISESEVMAVLG